jgi:hypothetical protein
MSTILTSEQMKWARDGAKHHVRQIFGIFPGLERELAYERKVAQAAKARAAKQTKRRGRK